MGTLSSKVQKWYQELVDLWNLLPAETRNKLRGAYQAVEGAFAMAAGDALIESIMNGGFHRGIIKHALSIGTGAAVLAYRNYKVQHERVVFTDAERAAMAANTKVLGASSGA